jgi:hypothetical protein
VNKIYNNIVEKHTLRYGASANHVGNVIKIVCEEFTIELEKRDNLMDDLISKVGSTLETKDLVDLLKKVRGLRNE